LIYISLTGTILWHDNVNVWSREQNTNPIQGLGPEGVRIYLNINYSHFSRWWPTKCFLLADYRWISLDYAYRISGKERMVEAEWGTFSQFPLVLANTKISTIFPARWRLNWGEHFRRNGFQENNLWQVQASDNTKL